MQVIFQEQGYSQMLRLILRHWGGYDRVIAALNSVGGKVKLDGGVLW